MAASGESMTWRRVAVAIPYLWLLVFFLLPFAIILKISLADPIIAQPPFTSTFNEQGGLSVTLDNFLFLLTDKLYAITCTCSRAPTSGTTRSSTAFLKVC